MDMYPSQGAWGEERLRSLRSELARCAREVWENWDQIDGFDEELGAGGICQDIAEAMASYLALAGIEDVLTIHSSVGENHVFLVALTDEGVFEIDIPPQVYETGSGYVWRKREDAVFSEEVVSISKIAAHMDVDTFRDTYSDC